MVGFQDGGTHVHPWLIQVDVWQNPPQYCKEIIFQSKKKKRLHASNVGLGGGGSSIPGGETKILHAAQRSQKEN